MGIVKSIKTNHFKLMKERGWNKVYYAFDIHGTILVPNYKAGDITKEFYPLSIKVLKMVSNLPDICTFIYSCSHPHEIDEYVAIFAENGIKFDYINENPEVKSDLSGYGCYDKKPYMNVLFEDKAGFDPEKDWKKVLKLLKKNYTREQLGLKK